MSKKWLHLNILAHIVLLILGFFFGQRLGRWSGYEPTRSIEKYQEEENAPGHLFLDVKVFCWVATHPASQKTKAYAVSVRRTWGQLCNRIVFFSNETDAELPVVLVNITESRGELWAKTREAFWWIYKNVLNDYEWFLKADDDTYMHMDNLRAFLQNYSPDDALAIGHQFRAFSGRGNYHSGGAGYVLSREAVKRVVSKGFAKLAVCKERNAHEDMFLGNCLDKLNVTFVDGADENGAYRFHVIALYDLLVNRVPAWLNETSKAKDSFSCCSPHFISMHYTKADEQYLIDYIAYRLKPYGVQY